MHIQRSVLVVDADPLDLSNTVVLLRDAGYRVASAAAFDEAKQLLATGSPDLLITGIRLGPYNGLHLVLRSRADHPQMAAIVTSPYHDIVLEAEAERQHANFVVRPFHDSAFLETVRRCLDATALPAGSPSMTGGTNDAVAQA